MYERDGFRENRGGGGNRGGFNRGGDSQRFAPVKVDDELDVKIEAVGEKGDGIAKKDGFVIFVPNVKAGDEVRIRVNKVLRKVGFAEVVGSATGQVGSSAPKAAPKKEEEKEISEDDMANDSEDFGEDKGDEDEFDDADSDEADNQEFEEDDSDKK